MTIYMQRYYNSLYLKAVKISVQDSDLKAPY